MRKTLVLGLVALAWLVAAQTAQAIPAFARRYAVSCRFCHEGFPKLSDAGRRFKERGFRMASEDGFDARSWIRSVPVVLRGWGNQLLVENGDDFTSGYLKAVSAGNLGRRLSYWVDDAILITEGDDNFTHVEPDNAWARLELLTGERLYLRAGRFELELPFTQTRTPHLFSYDIFNVSSGFESDSIGGYQDGAEIGGSFRNAWRWSAAVVKGRNSAAAAAFSDDVGRFDANVYVRLSRRVERSRFGALAYFGRSRLARSPAIVWDNKLQRWGADANIWAGKLNLYGAFLHGRDSNPFANAANPRGTGRAQSFDGIVAQADWHVRERLVLTGRLNLVHQPSQRDGGDKRTFSSLFPGVQLFLFEHGKLSFEYGFLNQSRSSLGAVQAEFAF